MSRISLNPDVSGPDLLRIVPTRTLLAVDDAMDLMPQVPKWRLGRGKPARIEREYEFADWKSAIAFVNAVSQLAEAEQHHPDVELAWGRVLLSLHTHAVGGLTLNDFVLASKIDAIPA
jgi:4a-hydroxytetrahydrobiopterin dehydratase